MNKLRQNNLVSNEVIVKQMYNGDDPVALVADNTWVYFTQRVACDAVEGSPM